MRLNNIDNFVPNLPPKTEICGSGYYDTPDGCFAFVRWEGDYIVLRTMRQKEVRYHKNDCAPANKSSFS
jgi:hypothetical protein